MTMLLLGNEIWVFLLSLSVCLSLSLSLSLCLSLSLFSYNVPNRKGLHVKRPWMWSTTLVKLSFIHSFSRVVHSLITGCTQSTLLLLAAYNEMMERWSVVCYQQKTTTQSCSLVIVGFFLEWEDFGRMFDKLFPTCAFCCCSCCSFSGD